MKKTMILDNYDSYTYNLVKYVRELTGQAPDVFFNDEVDLDRVNDYDYIILSPGPGLPSEAGKMYQLLERYLSRKRILGVCLGHQAIVEVTGGQIINLKKAIHGISSECRYLDPEDELFKNIPNPFKAGRYHSWAALEYNLPNCLKATAYTGDDHINMAVRHKEFPVFGLQFHPESVMTPYGKHILAAFLEVSDDFPPLILE